MVRMLISTARRLALKIASYGVMHLVGFTPTNPQADAALATMLPNGSTRFWSG